MPPPALAVNSSTVRAHPVVPPGATGNAIIINPNQRPNPILEHVKNVNKEFGDIKADFQVGRTTCILFLSLKYHRLHPEYIGGRIEKLGNAYNLRIVLVLCDVTEHQTPIRELTKMCLINNMTIIVAFSAEDAGQYIVTFKQYEHKPPDLIKERVDKDYNSVLRAALTSISKLNKTDVETLRAHRGSFADIARATPAQLSILPGFGQIKVRRIKDAFEKPFRNNATNSTGPSQEMLHSAVDESETETFTDAPGAAGPSEPRGGASSGFTWGAEVAEGGSSTLGPTSSRNGSGPLVEATRASSSSLAENDDAPRIPSSAKGKGRAWEPPVMNASPRPRAPRPPSPDWDIESDNPSPPPSRAMGPPVIIPTRKPPAPTEKRRSVYDTNTAVKVVSSTTISTRAPTKKPPLPRPRPLPKKTPTSVAEMGPLPAAEAIPDREEGDGPVPATTRLPLPAFDLDLISSDEQEATGQAHKRHKGT